MKLSKEQKIIRQKMEALGHPGVLMMLVDFLNNYSKNHEEYTIPKQEVPKVVSVVAARLKVMYMNQITPIEESKQMEIEQNVAIEEIVKIINK